MRWSANAFLDPGSALAKIRQTVPIRTYRANDIIYSQGDAADTVCYVQKGVVKLTVVSNEGKEAVIGFFGAGDFFGESCLSSQSIRFTSATAASECLIACLSKEMVMRMLRDDSSFSELFLQHLLSRNARVEEDLVDHLFNSSERRLARVLLLLASIGKGGKPEPITTKLSHDTLAKMVGTTRSRITFFLNKFRRLGFIDYNDELEIHSSLLTFIQHGSKTADK